MPHKDPEESADYKRQWEEKQKENNRFRQRERKAKNRKITDEIKSVPCTDCGVQYPPYVMDLDHVRGEKTGMVSAMLHYGEDRIREEISKTEVVCANCHRERTHQRLQE